MKKKILFVFICLIFSFSVEAQTVNNSNIPAAEKLNAEQSGALSEIIKLNAQVATLYRQKKFDEALPSALQLREIAEKNGLTKDSRVLPALSNLGEVYLAQGKESEAIEVFQEILNAYREKSSEPTIPAAAIAERIAAAYFYKKDYDKAEEFYLKALAMREKLNGAESGETARLSSLLGGVSRQRNKFDEASVYYLKAIEINDKILSDKEKENRTDISDYECFLYHKAFNKNRFKEVDKEIAKFHKSREKLEKKINGGVVNGKALKLPQPNVPANIRQARLKGFVTVRVTIDEQGNVTDAKATCGIGDFVEAAEAAARNAKFAPTLIAGKPIKVTGKITYNFDG